MRKVYIEVKNKGQNITDKNERQTRDKQKVYPLNIRHLIIYFLDSKILFIKGLIFSIINIEYSKYIIIFV